MKEALTFPVFIARGMGWERLLWDDADHTLVLSETLI